MAHSPHSQTFFWHGLQYSLESVKQAYPINMVSWGMPPQCRNPWNSGSKFPEEFPWLGEHICKYWLPCLGSLLLLLAFSQFPMLPVQTWWAPELPEIPQVVHVALPPIWGSGREILVPWMI
ncbi:hypothetical protein Pelo_16651 [Pelomyxa schiedti]|nr:hypothetical protein Pelo_16651 [Pelomyxa schiedti]